jgi:hypothetical protein
MANLPVQADIELRSSLKGRFEAGGRLSTNAVMNFLYALKESRQRYFSAEYSNNNKKERFSNLGARENVGAIIESCE